MPQLPFIRAATVLILKADRLFADMLHQHVVTAFPTAICTVAHRVQQAENAFSLAPFDLFVTGIDTVDGDLLDLLSRWKTGERPARAVLVVSSCDEPWLLASLRTLPIDGIFDSSTDSLENMASALRAVMGGHNYWSPNIIEALACPTETYLRLRLLTPTERLVLATIGDGSDDRAAGTWLGMKSSAIQAVRRSLHDKLRVHQKGDLVRMAVQYGFVRFTPKGARRMGFGMLLAEYQARSKRPVALPPELAAAYGWDVAAARRQ